MSAAQLSMLDESGRWHAGGHETERIAAESVKVRPLQEKVLAILRATPGGCTDDEGAAELRRRFGGDVDRLTFGRRRSELARAGLVVKSPVTRLSPRGRSAIVWRVA